MNGLEAWLQSSSTLNPELRGVAGPAFNDTVSALHGGHQNAMSGLNAWIAGSPIFNPGSGVGQSNEFADQLVNRLESVSGWDGYWTEEAGGQHQAAKRHDRMVDAAAKQQRLFQHGQRVDVLKAMGVLGAEASIGESASEMMRIEKLYRKSDPYGQAAYRFGTIVAGEDINRSLAQAAREAQWFAPKLMKKDALFNNEYEAGLLKFQNDNYFAGFEPGTKEFADSYIREQNRNALQQIDRMPGWQTAAGKSARLEKARELGIDVTSPTFNMTDLQAVESVPTDTKTSAITKGGRLIRDGFLFAADMLVFDPAQMLGWAGIKVDLSKPGLMADLAIRHNRRADDAMERAISLFADPLAGAALTADAPLGAKVVRAGVAALPAIAITALTGGAAAVAGGAGASAAGTVGATMGAAQWISAGFAGYSGYMAAVGSIGNLYLTNPEATPLDAAKVYGPAVGFAMLNAAFGGVGGKIGDIKNLPLQAAANIAFSTTSNQAARIVTKSFVAGTQYEKNFEFNSDDLLADLIIGGISAPLTSKATKLSAGILGRFAPVTRPSLLPGVPDLADTPSSASRPEVAKYNRDLIRSAQDAVRANMPKSNGKPVVLGDVGEHAPYTGYSINGKNFSPNESTPKIIRDHIKKTLSNLNFESFDQLKTYVKNYERSIGKEQKLLNQIARRMDNPDSHEFQQSSHLVGIQRAVFAREGLVHPEITQLRKALANPTLPTAERAKMQRVLADKVASEGNTRTNLSEAYGTPAAARQAPPGSIMADVGIPDTPAARSLFKMMISGEEGPLTLAQSKLGAEVSASGGLIRMHLQPHVPSESHNAGNASAPFGTYRHLNRVFANRIFDADAGVGHSTTAVHGMDLRNDLGTKVSYSLGNAVRSGTSGTTSDGLLSALSAASAAGVSWIAPGVPARSARTVFAKLMFRNLVDEHVPLVTGNGANGNGGINGIHVRQGGSSRTVGVNMDHRRVQTHSFAEVHASAQLTANAKMGPDISGFTRVGWYTKVVLAEAALMNIGRY
jgi:ribosomal protein S20